MSHTTKLIHKDWQDVPNIMEILVGGKIVTANSIRGGKPTLLCGLAYFRAGTSHVLRTDIPVIIGASRELMVVGCAKDVNIIQCMVDELKNHGASFGEIALSIFVPNEMEEQFYEAARTTGLREFFILDLDLLAKQGQNVAISWAALSEKEKRILH